MKTYKFPCNQAGTTGDVEKTLAAPTNARITGMLELLGLKSFSEMFSPHKMIGGLVAKLDLAIDKKQIRKAMDLCLVEGCEDVDIDIMDICLFDDMVQDFFEQRATNMTERLKSSIAG